MKIVVGITGASGAIYAKTLLDLLATTPHEVALVISENAHQIAQEELGLSYTHYDKPIFGMRDFAAPFASGSAKWDQMVIIPSSMGTIGRVAHGLSDDLLARTADVFLKERRKIIFVPRETPWSLIHIENIRLLALAGAVILPAIPSFYSRPQNLQEAVNTVASRVLDQMGIENSLMNRYGDR